MRSLLLVAVLVTAAACRTAAPAQAIPIDAPPPAFVPGEALVRSDTPLTPEQLKGAGGLAELVVLAVEPQFGSVYLVRFRQVDGTGRLTADEEFTRRAIAALKTVEGVLSAEPNALENARSRP